MRNADSREMSNLQTVIEEIEIYYLERGGPPEEVRSAITLPFAAFRFLESPSGNGRGNGKGTAEGERGPGV